MSKVHQLLAIEKILNKTAQESLKVLKKRFGNVQSFIGQTRTYQPKTDGGHVFPPENVILQFKVNTLLDELLSDFAKHIDCQLQKETSNAETSASVEIGGKIVVENLPAPALLNLEARLEELNALYKQIPVNAVDINWIYNKESGDWDSEPQYTDKTKKENVPVTLAEPTKEHPAQVQIVSEDVIIGRWKTQLHTGLLSPSDLKYRQDRINQLLIAVKKAIRKANDGEVVSVNVGDSILKFINTGEW